MSPMIFAISALQELDEDMSIPTSVRNKVAETLRILNQKDLEQGLKLSKALSELEMAAQDTNLQSDIRTQLFTISTLLETA